MNYLDENRNYLNKNQVMNCIHQEIKKLGSQKIFCYRVGISQGYLGDMLNERREISTRVLSYLGLYRETIYRKDLADYKK